MDWLVWITQLVTLALLLVVGNKVYRVDERLRVVLQSLNQFRVRQSQIRQAQSSHQNPQVDAKGKTSVRDTPDIPVRGARMSTAVHRKPYDVRDTEDR